MFSPDIITPLLATGKRNVFFTFFKRTSAETSLNQVERRINIINYDLYLYVDLIPVLKETNMF